MPEGYRYLWALRRSFGSGVDMTADQKLLVRDCSHLLRTCLHEHLGDSAMGGQDVRLAESDKIPDGVLEHPPHRPRGGAGGGQSGDLRHEMETGQQGR